MSAGVGRRYACLIRNSKKWLPVGPCSAPSNGRVFDLSRDATRHVTRSVNSARKSNLINVHTHALWLLILLLSVFLVKSRVVFVCIERPLAGHMRRRVTRTRPDRAVSWLHTGPCGTRVMLSEHLFLMSITVPETVNGRCTEICME